MHSEESSHKESIRRAVNSINDNWLKKRYHKIGDHLAEKIVVYLPGAERCLYSREEYIRSYREYDQSATTNVFSPGDPEIDIFSDTAVAACPFYIEYQLDGKLHREKGLDILVFSFMKDQWKLVWRNLQAETVK